MEWHELYLIEDAMGAVKVGMAENAIRRKRALQAQYGNASTRPFKIIRICRMERGTVVCVERLVHAMLNDRRLIREPFEWFATSKQHASRCINRAIKMVRNHKRKTGKTKVKWQRIWRAKSTS